jgi:hypothetical protein
VVRHIFQACMVWIYTQRTLHQHRKNHDY